MATIGPSMGVCLARKQVVVSCMSVLLCMGTYIGRRLRQQVIARLIGKVQQQGMGMSMDAVWGSGSLQGEGNHAAGHWCQRGVCCDVHKRMAMQFVEAGAGSVGRTGRLGGSCSREKAWTHVMSAGAVTC